MRLSFPKFCMRVLSHVATVALVLLPAIESTAAHLTSTWNDSTGNWSDASWNTNPLFPNNGNGGNTYDAIINGGSVTLDQDIAIKTVTMAGGGGSISGSFNLAADTLNLDGTLSGTSNYTFQSLNWNTGGMFGSGTTTIPSGGTLTFTNPGTSVQLYRTLVNNGSAAITDTSVNFGAGTFQNNGSFTVTEHGVHNFATQVNFTSNAFNNSGTFTKLGPGTTGFLSPASGSSFPFNNTGTVDVQAGTLNLESGVAQHIGTALTGGVWPASR